MITQELIAFIEDSSTYFPQSADMILDDLFSISGYPHYEDVISNWLAFFIASNNDHGYLNLFGEAFKKCISDKTIDENIDWLSNDIFTGREILTSKRNFIDLIVYDQGDLEKREFQNCLIIEHKVNAGLYNDLNDYYNSMKVQDSKTAIILSAKKRDDKHIRFINVSYAEILVEIRGLIGKYQLRANYKHILYLTDLLNNMDNLSDNMTNEEIDFCFKYGKQIKEVQRLKTIAETKLIEQVKAILSESDYIYNRKYPNSFSIWAENNHISIVFSLESIFSEGHSEFQYWIRDEWVLKWNKVNNITSIIEYCKEMGFKPSPKKIGKDWVEITRGRFVLGKNQNDFDIQLFEFLEEAITPLTQRIQSLIVDVI